MNPSVTIKGGKEPGRNDLCPCGSKLKYKWCHGDPGKRAVCEAAMRETMVRLIIIEKHKRDMITDEQLEAVLNPSENEEIEDESGPKIIY
jgi:hypothetical protein